MVTLPRVVSFPFWLFQIGLYRQTFPIQVSENVTVNQWLRRAERERENVSGEARRGWRGIEKQRKGEVRNRS